MTTLASPAGLKIAARDSSLTYWAARSAIYAAIVCVTLTALPNAPGLALAHWLGARVAHDGVSGAGIGSLGALCAWAVSAGGTALFLGFAGIAALVACACCEQRARMLGGRTLGLAAVVVAALCSFDALRAGGGIVSAAFAAALALTLERNDARRTIVAAAITVAWCNSSADGILAPIIALTFALGALFDRDGRTHRRSSWYAVGACALATLVTPSFGAFPAQAPAALRVDQALVDIVAMHPADVAPAAYRVGFMLVVLAFLAIGSGTRVRAGDVFLVSFATVLALANGTYLALFGVLLAPILARSAYETLARGDARDTAYGVGDLLLWIGAIAAVSVLAIICAPRADAAIALQPYALANPLLVQKTPRHFYCANVDWCGYILATGPRGTRVLLDGRIGTASPVDIAAQRTIAHVSPGWRAILDRRHIDVVIANRHRSLATLLALRGDWQSVARDESAELFVRTRATR